MIDDDRSQLYPYSYNEENDVYLIRGIFSCETSFFPRAMDGIPSSMIHSLGEEYRLTHGGELKPRLSFSKDRFYAALDFHNRVFSNEEIMQMARLQNVTPRRVEPEKESNGRAFTLSGKFDKSGKK